jgi:hypothetical protein
MAQNRGHNGNPANDVDPASVSALYVCPARSGALLRALTIRNGARFGADLAPHQKRPCLYNLRRIWSKLLSPKGIERLASDFRFEFTEVAYE